MKHPPYTKKNKIPHIVHVTSSLKRGGAESLLCTLIHHFQQKNIKQTVIYFHKGPYVDWLEEQHIPSYHIQGLICLYDPIFWFRLISLLRKLQPTGIHGWLWAANIAARIINRVLHIPAINAIHNNIDQDGPLRLFIDKITANPTVPIVAVSPGVAQTIKAYYPTRKTPLYTIVNGIDAKTIQYQAKSCALSRKDLHIASDSFVIGTVGRLVPEKNISLLIKTFNQFHGLYPQSHLIVVGSGPEEILLRNLVATYDLTHATTFLIDQPALGIYPLLNCFVLTSYKEGISMALLEAMSCRLPCISTTHALTHDVITDSLDGILIKNHHEAEVLKALRYIIDNPMAAQRLAENAYNTASTLFCSQNMLANYQSLYEQQRFL